MGTLSIPTGHSASAPNSPALPSSSREKDKKSAKDEMKAAFQMAAERAQRDIDEEVGDQKIDKISWESCRSYIFGQVLVGSKITVLFVGPWFAWLNLINSCLKALMHWESCRSYRLQPCTGTSIIVL